MVVSLANLGRVALQAMPSGPSPASQAPPGQYHPPSQVSSLFVLFGFDSHQQTPQQCFAPRAASVCYRGPLSSAVFDWAIVYGSQ
jgi:hypothetical protein